MYNETPLNPTSIYTVTLSMPYMICGPKSMTLYTFSYINNSFAHLQWSSC